MERIDSQTIRLVERTKEDIYFVERDRELLERLRAQLHKGDTASVAPYRPKCSGG
jgi:hypothetical protein